MKWLVCILILFAGCGINPTYRKLDLQQKTICTPATITDSLRNDSIYSLTYADFKTLVFKSNKPYHLYISYTYWCHSVKFNFPSLLSLDTISNLQTYFVTPDDWYYLNQYKNYLYWQNYHNPTFILNIHAYGNKFNPHKRFSRFKREFCLDCKEVSGFPSLMLFDKNCNLIFKDNGNFRPDLLVQIKNLISTP
jgi:hypothetical protein